MAVTIFFMNGKVIELPEATDVRHAMFVDTDTGSALQPGIICMSVTPHQQTEVGRFRVDQIVGYALTSVRWV